MQIILAFAVAVIVGSIGTILIKIGTNKMPAIGFSFQSLWQIATNIYIISGIILYVASFPAYSYILQKMNVSIAYPIFTSLSFATVILISTIFLKESLTIVQILGLLLVVGGISLIGFGAAR